MSPLLRTEKVIEAIRTLAQSQNAAPSSFQIATTLGVSEQDLQDFLITLSVENQSNSLRVFTQTVLLGLAEKAAAGNASAAALFFKVVWKDHEKTETTAPTIILPDGSTL